MYLEGYYLNQHIYNISAVSMSCGHSAMQLKSTLFVMIYCDCVCSYKESYQHISVLLSWCTLLCIFQIWLTIARFHLRIGFVRLQFHQQCRGGLLSSPELILLTLKTLVELIKTLLCNNE